MATGRGVRHTAGPGLVMSPGAGHLITMAAGSTTTTIGPGVPAVNTIATEAGGAQRWSLLFRFTFPLEITFAGTHFHIMSETHTRATTEWPTG